MNLSLNTLIYFYILFTRELFLTTYIVLYKYIKTYIDQVKTITVLKTMLLRIKKEILPNKKINARLSSLLKNTMLSNKKCTLSRGANLEVVFE